MATTESRFRLEETGLMSDSLTDLLCICMRSVNGIENQEIKSMLHIAINVSQGISEGIDKIVEEIIEANK